MADLPPPIDYVSLQEISVPASAEYNRAVDGLSNVLSGVELVVPSQEARRAALVLEDSLLGALHLNDKESFENYEKTSKMSIRELNNEFDNIGLTEGFLAQRIQNHSASIEKRDAQEKLAKMSVSDFTKISNKSLGNAMTVMDLMRDMENNDDLFAKNIALLSIVKTYTAEQWDVDALNKTVGEIQNMNSKEVIAKFGMEHSPTMVRKEVRDELAVAKKTYLDQPTNINDLVKNIEIQINDTGNVKNESRKSLKNKIS